MGRGVRRPDRRRGRPGGKSGRPDRGADRPLSAPAVKEGDEADEAVAEHRRRSTSRRELARHERFEDVSPEVGELDEAALERALGEDPDETMALLADLTGATDARLRALARRLAGRLFLDLARRGPTHPRGVGRLVTRPYRPDGGDLDVDASLDEVIAAQSGRRALVADELRVRSWATPDTALCLLVDRSGSMGGEPLATAALAAATVAWRSPADYSVLSFARDVVAAKSQDADRACESVVDAVLALRGIGTTDLAGAIRAAAEQLARSNAGRKITVLLSDCRATVPGDAVAAAARLDELVIVAPAGDDADAVELAQLTGARSTTVAGPSDAAAALSRVLDS